MQRNLCVKRVRPPRSPISLSKMRHRPIRRAKYRHTHWRKVAVCKARNLDEVFVGGAGEKRASGALGIAEARAAPLAIKRLTDNCSV